MYVCMYVCVCVYVCMYVCVYVGRYVRTYVRRYVCIRGICVFNQITLLTIKARCSSLTILLYLLSLLCHINCVG